MTTVSYEQRLSADLNWAWTEGSRYFEGRSAVHDALRRIVKRFAAGGIPYIVGGDLAMFVHGYRRFTEEIVLIVNPGDFFRFRECLGPDYVLQSSKSRMVREVETGVRIRFQFAGEYSGNTVQIPVPELSAAFTDTNGIPYLTLPKLIELNVAAYVGVPGLTRERADVQELIKSVRPPLELMEQLHVSVRAEYARAWKELQDIPDEPAEWQESWERHLDTKVPCSRRN